MSASNELFPLTISSTNLAATDGTQVTSNLSQDIQKKKKRTCEGRQNAILPEAVRASCSRADSVLGISSAACARRSNEDTDRNDENDRIDDPDLCIASIAISVSDFTSISGGVEETDTFCSDEGDSSSEADGGAIQADAFSANLPLGLYVDGGRSQGGVGGLFSSSISPLTAFPPIFMLITVALDATTAVMAAPFVIAPAMPGDLTRFVWATRS